jgi:hypothetical protein
MKKTYRIQNTEKKKTKTNNRRESFKVKESELSPASSPVKKNKESTRDLIVNSSSDSDYSEKDISLNEKSSLSNLTTNGVVTLQENPALTTDLTELHSQVDNLKIDPTLLEKNKQLLEENLELKSKLEILQSKFDNLLGVHRKTKSNAYFTFFIHVFILLPSICDSSERKRTGLKYYSRRSYRPLCPAGTS